MVVVVHSPPNPNWTLFWKGNPPPSFLPSFLPVDLVARVVGSLMYLFIVCKEFLSLANIILPRTG